VPSSWDFPHADFDEWQLTEVKVGTWGGFVFINPDPDAAPLEDFLGDLDRHFAKYDYQNRYTAAHVVKVMPCNWKAAQEAFMESFHVIAVHPQLLPESSNLDAQYDAWGNFSRAISPNFLPSAFLSWLPTEQEILDSALDRRLDRDPVVTVPEGMTAREVGADQARAALAPVIGQDKAAELCDSEMADSFYFTLFPNLHPWSAYNRICFRFRPYGNDPDRAIQDVYLLNPYAGERPPASATHVLSIDEDFTAGTEMGPYLARILNQDLYNMPKVQEGMKATRKPVLTFSRYQESKIRHFHKLLDEWTARP
jgi:Ring hydroxylating alpha subunit (catalytic domain)